MNINKMRGQVTLFVVIAIVVIVVIVSLLIFKESEDAHYDSKIDVIRDNHLSCFEEAYIEALLFVSYQGGYFDKPKEIPSVELTNSFIPYYYYDGELYSPSLESIQEEIKQSAKSSILNCLTSGSEDGRDYFYSDYSLDVKILENFVVFTLDLDMSVVMMNKTHIIDFVDKPITINSRLKDMHFVASQIARGYGSAGGDWFDITEMSELSAETGLNISVVESDVDYPSFIYTIYTLDGNSYPINYQFANKLTWPDFHFPESGLSN